MKKTLKNASEASGPEPRLGRPVSIRVTVADVRRRCSTTAATLESALLLDAEPLDGADDEEIQP